MRDGIRQMLTDLDIVRENLLAYADDAWVNIDRWDPSGRDQGIEFVKTYDEKVAAFSVLAAELSAMIQQREDVHIDDTIGVMHDQPRNERIIRELDTATPHSLDENFTSKRPYGFVLEGQAFTGITTWRELYFAMCRHLAHRDPATFTTIPGDPHFVGTRGKWSFSRNPKHMIVPLPITQEIYAEGNLSANSVRDNIKRLLEKSGIRSQALKLYLRQDRDAGRDGVE